MYLPFLPEGTEEFDSYLHEMNYCLVWAVCNRKEMMRRTMEVISYAFPDVLFEEPIDIHHNYVAVERHYDQKLYVHRKEAVSTGVYIREGENKK
jgi:tRNA-splicing ligase RtcB